MTMAKWDNSSSWWAGNDMHKQRPRAKALHTMNGMLLKSDESSGWPCCITFLGCLRSQNWLKDAHLTWPKRRNTAWKAYLIVWLQSQHSLDTNIKLYAQSHPPLHTHASSPNRAQFIHISNIAHPLATKPTHLSCVSFLLNDYKKNEIEKNTNERTLLEGFDAPLTNYINAFLCELNGSSNT